jgi:hypothetical protein
MAYNAALANFMESQGIPYAGGLANLPAAQETPMAAQAAPMAASMAAPVTPNYTDLITQAYGSIGVTTPDAPGVDYFRTQLQSGAIRPEDFQRSFLTTAAGVTDPTYAANVAKAQELLGGLNKSAVEQAYQTVLGRAGDTEGVKYFTEQLGLGALRPDQLTSTLSQAAIPVAKSLEDRLALQKYLGKDIYAPEAYLKGTSGMGYQDIVDYANLNVQDPVKVAQFAARYGIDPSEILAAKQAVGGQDIPTIKAIEDYLAQGRTGFADRYQNTLESIIGSTDDITQFEKNRPTIEKNLGLQAGSLKSSYNIQDFSNKSIEEIEKLLQSSGANRYQEAANLSNLAKNIYGLTENQAKDLRADLLKGTKVDEIYKKSYDELLTGGLSKELETKILQDAAVRTPNSPYFQKNPDKLAIYQPIGEIKSNPEGSNQYGIDSKTGLPFIHLGAAKNLMGNEVFVLPGREQLGQDKLGLDPHSAYQGFIANGVGLFGVKSSKDDIDYFDKIEKEISKLGGIKTRTSEEGQVQEVVLVKQIDPENGREYVVEIPVQTFFSKPSDEGGENFARYEEYRNTQAGLSDAAAKAGVPENKYTSIKQAYDDLNNRFKDLYLIQGRTDTLDPAAAKTLGISDLTKNSQHATLLYQAVGDKLVPFVDPKTGESKAVLKTFDFKDPNTSRGFFGDLAGNITEILSIPPIAMALSMAGGLPALLSGNLGVGATYGVTSEAFKNAMASSIFNPANLGATLFPNIVDKGIQTLLGNAILQGGMSGLTTGLATGDLGKAGISALSGATGATVAGATPILFGDMAKQFNISPAALKIGSELLGGSAATAVTGQDPGKYAVNRLLNIGLGTLANFAGEKTGIPTKGPEAEIFKAMTPIIANKKVTPDDIVRLASAVQKFEPQKVG